MQVLVAIVMSLFLVDLSQTASQETVDRNFRSSTVTSEATLTHSFLKTKHISSFLSAFGFRQLGCDVKIFQHGILLVK